MTNNSRDRSRIRDRMRGCAVAALWLCLIVLLPQTASAYIDPGSGSFVIQALIAMFAGIVVTGRLYWTKIRSILGLGSVSDDDDDQSDDD
jgi:hypothetical protein